MLAKIVNDNACILEERGALVFFASKLLAKIVNDNACILDERGALVFFASKLAPTRAL